MQELDDLLHGFDVGLEIGGVGSDFGFYAVHVKTVKYLNDINFF